MFTLLFVFCCYLSCYSCYLTLKQLGIFLNVIFLFLSIPKEQKGGLQNCLHPSIHQSVCWFVWPKLCITQQTLGQFIFSNIVPYNCNFSIWNWSNIINIYSALWILMAWYLNSRASVTTVLSTCPSISSCLWVKCADLTQS